MREVLGVWIKPGREKCGVEGKWLRNKGIYFFGREDMSSENLSAKAQTEVWQKTYGRGLARNALDGGSAPVPDLHVIAGKRLEWVTSSRCATTRSRHFPT